VKQKAEGIERRAEREGAESIENGALETDWLYALISMLSATP
jgi:hypothetical protein